jgi:outer membrane protein OmpA-like peptidoglycan-associated protein
MKMSQRAMVLALCLVTSGGVAQAADKSWWGTPGSTEPARTALADQAPETEALPCGLDQKYNVIGFNRNSNELTKKLQLRLDQVAADIGAHRCSVQIVGYSSHEGDLASNALFAVERAQNALSYLRAHGVKFTRVSATGAGATEQFGDDFALNRRVVIAIAP